MNTVLAIIAICCVVILCHVSRRMQRRDHFKRTAELMRGFVRPEGGEG